MRRRRSWTARSSCAVTRISTRSRNLEGSRFQVPGSGFQVPGSGFRVPGSRFRVPGSRFQVRDFDVAILRETVARLIVEADYNIPADIFDALRTAAAGEESP